MNKIERIKQFLDNIKINNQIPLDKDFEIIEKIKSKPDITEEDINFLKNYNKKLGESFYTIVKDDFQLFAIPELFEVKEGKKDLKRNVSIEYEIKITPDEQQAFITIKNIPETKITESDIIEILNKNNVTHCIIEEKIKKICNDYNNGISIINELVAQGKMPQYGEDGYIDLKFQNDENLVKNYLKEKFESLKDVSPDEYNNISLEDFIENEVSKRRIRCGLVKKNELLAIKVLPTKGEDGLTVTGKILPGRFGTEPDLKIKRNVKFFKELNQYISEIDGLAIFEDNTLWVKRFAKGNFKLDISPDKMKLYLTVIPSIGGASPADLNEILNKINEMQISVPVDKLKIKETIEKSEKEHKVLYNVTIAEGIQPQNGNDGYIEYKIKLASGKRFKELENGRIDFYEQDLLTLVKKEDLIAIIYKPSEGIKDGMTITGEIIKAEPGKPYNISIGKGIRVVDFPDKKELYSEIDGHLKIDDYTLSVLPIYIIEEDVGFKTGNINFNGDIIIKGDVKENFKVRAEGDILIYGNVEAAEISSKRDIIIKSGILGKNKGKIFSNKNLYAKFIENCYVEVQNDIVIEESIVGCKIFCNGSVILKSSKSQIINSEIYASDKIISNFIGSEIGSKVKLILGYDYKILNGIEQLKQEENEHLNNIKQIEQILNSLSKSYGRIEKSLPEIKKLYTESISKKSFILNQLKILKNKETNLMQKLIKNESPEIIAYDVIFSDVYINYAGKSFILREDYKNIKIKKIDNRINIIKTK